MCRSTATSAAFALLLSCVTATAWGVESQPAAAAEPSASTVRYADGRLTVKVDHMPIADVLRRIGDATGAVVRGNMPTGDVTVAVEDVPLTVALDTVLGKHSFMLTYGPKGVVRTIDLLGAGPPVTAAPVAAAPAATPAPPFAAEEAQAAVLQRTVAPWGSLIGAFGPSEPLTVGRLLHAVVNDQRPEVRAAARESILEQFRSHPEVEAAYLSTLTPVDDTTLAGMMRASTATDGAEEWFAALTMRAGSPELKQKASTVLALLRASLASP